MTARSDVRSVLIGALAEKRRRDVGELEAELRAAGSECPYDSIWLVKAGVHAARQLGFRLKPGKSEAAIFKSVEALTTYLHRKAQDQEAA